MRAILTLAVFCLAFAPLPSRAEGCPSQTFELDAILAALRKAPTCGRAFATFEACSAGSTMDVQFADVVIRKCEEGVLHRLSAQARARYHAAARRCWRKHRQQEGTMYRALEAACAAGLARDTARRFSAR